MTLLQLILISPLIWLVYVEIVGLFNKESLAVSIIAIILALATIAILLPVIK